MDREQRARQAVFRLVFYGCWRNQIMCRSFRTFLGAAFLSAVALSAEAGDPLDPLDRIEQAFAREVSRLDRSDDFLERSRAAVQRAQDRLEALRHSNRPDAP